MDKYKKDKHPNIRSFTQNQGVGKTLEYQMAFENENNSLLLTPSIQNQSELKDIIGLLEEEKNTEDIVKRYDLFGKDAKGLYLLDAELASRMYTPPTLVL